MNKCCIKGITNIFHSFSKLAHNYIYYTILSNKDKEDLAIDLINQGYSQR